MSKTFTVVWPFHGEAITSHLTMESIAWLVAVIGIRTLRVWDFAPEGYPVQMKLLINREIYCVAVADRDNHIVDCANYYVPPQVS